MRMLSAGILKIFGVAGYLNDRDGLWGWRKLTFTSSLSSSTWRTHASHHCSSYTQAIKPVISSNLSSLSKTETLSSLEVVEEEYTFVETVSFVRGVNEWSFRVPTILRDC